VKAEAISRRADAKAKADSKKLEKLELKKENAIAAAQHNIAANREALATITLVEQRRRRSEELERLYRILGAEYQESCKEVDDDGRDDYVHVVAQRKRMVADALFNHVFSEVLPTPAGPLTSVTPSTALSRRTTNTSASSEDSAPTSVKKSLATVISTETEEGVDTDDSGDAYFGATVAHGQATTTNSSAYEEIDVEHVTADSEDNHEEDELLVHELHPISLDPVAVAPCALPAIVPLTKTMRVEFRITSGDDSVSWGNGVIMDTKTEADAPVYTVYNMKTMKVHMNIPHDSVRLKTTPATAVKLRDAVLQAEPAKPILQEARVDPLPGACPQKRTAEEPTEGDVGAKKPRIRKATPKMNL
jgi:hypothetical protein